LYESTQKRKRRWTNILTAEWWHGLRYDVSIKEVWFWIGEYTKRTPFTLSRHHNEPKFILRLLPRLSSNHDNNKSSNLNVDLFTSEDINDVNGVNEYYDTRNNRDTFSIEKTTLSKTPRIANTKKEKLFTRSLSLLKINTLDIDLEPTISLRGNQKLKKNTKKGKNNTQEKTTNVTQMIQSLSMNPDNHPNNNLIHSFISHSPVWSTFSLITPFYNETSLLSIMTKNTSSSAIINSIRDSNKVPRIVSTTNFSYQTPLKRTTVGGGRSRRNVKKKKNNSCNDNSKKTLFKVGIPPS